jgi:phage baseplate assembly protein W
MEISQVFGFDFTLNEKGGLALVGGIEETNQRIIRRLLTPENAYIWHIGYGAGVPQFVGDARSEALMRKIKSLIVSNIMKEETVSKTFAPVIDFGIIQGGINCTIQYKSAIDDQKYVLNFTVNN